MAERQEPPQEEVELAYPADAFESLNHIQPTGEKPQNEPAAERVRATAVDAGTTLYNANERLLALAQTYGAEGEAADMGPRVGQVLANELEGQLAPTLQDTLDKGTHTAYGEGSEVSHAYSDERVTEAHDSAVVTDELITNLGWVLDASKQTGERAEQSIGAFRSNTLTGPRDANRMHEAIARIRMGSGAQESEDVSTGALEVGRTLIDGLDRKLQEGGDEATLELPLGLNAAVEVTARKLPGGKDTEYDYAVVATQPEEEQQPEDVSAYPEAA